MEILIFNRFFLNNTMNSTGKEECFALREKEPPASRIDPSFPETEYMRRAMAADAGERRTETATDRRHMRKIRVT